MKRRKIGELNMPNMPGVFTFYEEEGKVNPYSIYYTYYAYDGKYSCPTKHKRLVERYGDFRSVMCHMHDMAFDNIYGRCFKGKEN